MAGAGQVPRRLKASPPPAAMRRPLSRSPHEGGADGPGTQPGRHGRGHGNAGDGEDQAELAAEFARLLEDLTAELAREHQERCRLAARVQQLLQRQEGADGGSRLDAGFAAGRADLGKTSRASHRRSPRPFAYSQSSSSSMGGGRTSFVEGEDDTFSATSMKLVDGPPGSRFGSQSDELLRSSARFNRSSVCGFSSSGAGESPTSLVSSTWVEASGTGGPPEGRFHEGLRHFRGGSLGRMPSSGRHSLLESVPDDSEEADGSPTRSEATVPGQHSPSERLSPDIVPPSEHSVRKSTDDTVHPDEDDPVAAAITDSAITLLAELEWGRTASQAVNAAAAAQAERRLSTARLDVSSGSGLDISSSEESGHQSQAHFVHTPRAQHGDHGLSTQAHTPPTALVEPDSGGRDEDDTDPDSDPSVFAYYRRRCMELSSQVHRRNVEVVRLRRALEKARSEALAASSVGASSGSPSRSLNNSVNNTSGLGLLQRGELSGGALDSSGGPPGGIGASPQSGGSGGTGSHGHAGEGVGALLGLGSGHCCGSEAGAIVGDGGGGSGGAPPSLPALPQQPRLRRNSDAASDGQAPEGD